MESNFVRVNSISIDLPIGGGAANKACEHFTIRGYVSDIRKKDWRKCWPFRMDESDDNPLPLPSLEAPKFRWWGCENCQQAIANEVNHGNDQPDVSHRNGGVSDCNCSNAVFNSCTQESPVASAATPVNAEFDLNIPIDLTGDTDELSVRNEIENNNAEIVQNRITDHNIGSVINLNHQLSSVTLPEVPPDHMEECHINKIASEANVEKSSSDINEGTPTSEENQGHSGLRQSASILRECTLAVGDNVNDHATEHLSPVADSNHDVPVENEDEIFRNRQDRDVERSTSLTRKRPRKMRLLKDLLNENGESKTNKSTANGLLSHCPLNQSATSDTPSISPEKVHAPVDSTLTNRARGRKRKFVVDEESRSTDMCSQMVDSEIQNPRGVSRTDNTAEKRHKAVEHVDKHLISRSQEGQWRESGSTVDFTNKENDKLSEDSFARTATKNMSSRVEHVAVPWTKCTSNGEELSEERHLPLKGFPLEQIFNKQNMSQREIQLPVFTPFQEGTSRARHRSMDRKTNYFGTRKNHSIDVSNAIPKRGKEVYVEGTNWTRNNNKMIEVVDLDNSLERCNDLTEDDSDNGSEDDIPMEVVEILARNQYERSLPDVENLSCQREMSDQREKDQVSDVRIGINRRQGNAFPGKENSSNFFSSLKANQFGIADSSTLHPSSFGLEVPQTEHMSSNWSHYSPMKGQNNASKRNVSQPTSSNLDFISLRSGLTQRQNRRRDIIDLNYPSSHYTDREKHPTNTDSGNMSSMNTERTIAGRSNETEHDRYQSESRDMRSNEAIHALHLLSLTGAGREIDTSSTAGRSPKMVRRPSNPGTCSANLERKIHGSPQRQISEYFHSVNLSDKSQNRLDSPFLATSSDQHGRKLRNPDFRDQNLPRHGNGITMSTSNIAMQNGDSLQLRGPNLERETPDQLRSNVSEPSQSISVSTIVVNRNPAEFTVLEDGNPYMINGEDLKFEDSPPKGRRGLPAARGRNQMRTQRFQNERH
ncbi:hypothetical protein PIB30_075025 [Stylosanthes scabra]|uniref:Protein EMBRYONIC FLOWER 1-like n=1 Tax=Stylosanthes scabra TaxID=79078 RepID=A0ABU6URL3_9FABA|nr:hypothetical protein [Stylosanthes scabra]